MFGKASGFGDDRRPRVCVMEAIRKIVSGSGLFCTLHGFRSVGQEAALSAFFATVPSIKLHTQRQNNCLWKS